jgi:hypothetical protein
MMSKTGYIEIASRLVTVTRSCFLCSTAIRQHKVSANATSEEKAAALDSLERTIFAILCHNVRPEDAKGKGSKGEKGSKGLKGKIKRASSSQFVNERGLPIEGFRITSEELQHSLCSISWCRYKKGDETFDVNSKLDPAFFKALLPIFTKVADLDLLSR